MTCVGLFVRWPRPGDLTHLQGELIVEGNGAAALAEYPKLDRFKRCYRAASARRLEDDAPAPATARAVEREAAEDSAAGESERRQEPDAFVRCETTAGDFTVEMHREWAPLGYDRFMELVEAEYFSDQVVYRVIPGPPHCRHDMTPPAPRPCRP